MNFPIATLFPLTRLVNVWAKPYGVSIQEVIQQGTDGIEVGAIGLGHRDCAKRS